MRRTYVTLLRLYPRDFRAAFAPEMVIAFERTAEERRTPAGLAWFAWRELAGLLTGAMAECLAKWTTDRCVRGRTLPDLLVMRPAGVSWEHHYRGRFVQKDPSQPE